MDDEFDYMDDEPTDNLDYVPYACRHGNELECEDCDAMLDECGGIDKCLNCGKYKAGSQLDENQVCRIGCVNPAEY